MSGAPSSSLQSPPSLADLRRRYAGAFARKPWIYWADLGVSAAVGWVAFAGALCLPVASLAWCATTALAIVALLRASIFIHELSHKRADQLRGFEVVWNLVVGLPLMLPSLMYVGSHNEHHRRSIFATPADPEYVPLAKWSRLRIALFICTVALIPPALALRWGVAWPLSLLIPPLRRLTVAKMSTLVINPDYERPFPEGRNRVRWALGEAGCCAAFWTAAALVFSGLVPWPWLMQWWIVGAGILVVNQVRTLAAHGYRNDGAELDSLGQLLDSINLRSMSLLTLLAAPVGMRFHALHHFLPGVPYHSLGALHRRLLAELPADASYRRTERRNIFAVVAGLFGLGDGGSVVAAGSSFDGVDEVRVRGV